MDRTEIEAALADVKRIESLQSCPAGDSGAWGEIKARAYSLTQRRAGLPGQGADLATKISYTVGYVVDAKPHQEDRERGRLTDQLRRLRHELEYALKGP